jgi:miniconductance mechanosensitive channel
MACIIKGVFMIDFIDSLMVPVYEKAVIPHGWYNNANTVIALLALIVVVLIVAKIANVLLLKIIQRLVRYTKTKWDDHLLDAGVFRRLSRLVPALIAYTLFPLFLYDTHTLIDHSVLVFIRRVILAYSAGTIAHIAAGFLDGANLIYQDSASEKAKKKPIKGYVQLLKVFIYIVGGILVVTTIADISPFGILSGFGAMSAVLLLVFKDSIMGFVSSMQLSANDMVRIGDWIEMPKYNADGDVIDITLQSIVVRNWDATITTIPIYSLISDSFKNWRGMTELGGRRIKRSITIDMRSIHFLSNEEIVSLSKIPLIAGYMKDKLSEIEQYNRTLNIAENDYVSGYHLTNVGTFRAYAEAYLASLPGVAKSMTHMVRHLQPDANGLPLELYLFSQDTRWIIYENLQADIIDHLLAVMPEFALRIFQNPSGADLQMIATSLESR